MIWLIGKRRSADELLLREIGERLQARLGTKVEVEAGKIRIEYYSDDDLQRLIDILLPGEEF